MCSLVLKKRLFLIIQKVLFIFSFIVSSFAHEGDKWQENWLAMNEAVKIAQETMIQNARVLLWHELELPSASPMDRNQRLCAECSVIAFEGYIRSHAKVPILEEWILRFMRYGTSPIIPLKVLNDAGKSIEHDIKIDEIHSPRYTDLLYLDNPFDSLFNKFIPKEFTFEKLYPVYLVRRLIGYNLRKRLSRELDTSQPSLRDSCNKRALRAQASLVEFETWMRKPQSATQIKINMMHYFLYGINPLYRLKVLNEKGKLEANYVTTQSLLYSPSIVYLTELSFSSAFHKLEDVFAEEGYDLGQWLGIVKRIPQLSELEAIDRSIIPEQNSPPRS